MPNYDYNCLKCNHKFEEQRKIIDRYKPISLQCPNCFELGGINMVLSNKVSIGDPVQLGHIKPNRQFNDRLKEIKKNYPGSTIRIRD